MTRISGAVTVSTANKRLDIAITFSFLPISPFFLFPVFLPSFSFQHSLPFILPPFLLYSLPTTLFSYASPSLSPSFSHSLLLPPSHFSLASPSLPPPSLPSLPSLPPISTLLSFTTQVLFPACRTSSDSSLNGVNHCLL